MPYLALPKRVKLFSVSLIGIDCLWYAVVRIILPPMEMKQLHSGDFSGIKKARGHDDDNVGRKLGPCWTVQKKQQVIQGSLRRSDKDIFEIY